MRKVEADIQINAQQEIVFNALTDFKYLKEWWGVERCLIERKKGGIYSLAWGITKEGFKYISSGIIAEYNPNNYLEISNLTYFNSDRAILGPMKLIFKIDEYYGKTKLSMKQDGYQSGSDWDWYYNAVNEAWPKVLYSLQEYLEKQR